MTRLEESFVDIDKPPQKKDIYNQLAEQLKSAKSAKDIKRIFADPHFTLSFYQRVSQGNNPLLIPISSAAKGYNYSHRKVAYFLDALANAGIPVKNITGGGGIYHLITSRHLEQARAAFASDPKLKIDVTPAVIQTFGPEINNIPTTTQINKGENYVALGNLKTEFGMSLYGNRRKIINLLGPDCPVPIFRRIKNGRPQYFCRIQDARELLEYLKSNVN